MSKPDEISIGLIDPTNPSVGYNVVMRQRGRIVGRFSRDPVTGADMLAHALSSALAETNVPESADPKYLALSKIQAARLCARALNEAGFKTRVKTSPCEVIVSGQAHPRARPWTARVVVNDDGGRLYMRGMTHREEISRLCEETISKWCLQHGVLDLSSKR